MGAHRSRADAESSAERVIRQSAANSCEEREQFYGRRKGRPLKAAESEALAASDLLLKGKEVGADLSSLFTQPVSQIHLEIGFGAGEHMLSRAEAHPKTGFIGAEAFLNGIAKCTVRAQQKKLGNLRIWPDDVRELLDLLPSSSIARIYLLYPDPWPKRRHWKRRIISDLNLSRLARILCENGEIYFATDWANYAAWTLAHFRRNPCFEWRAIRSADWLRPWPNWPSTRYEQKAIRENLKATYLTFRRTNRVETPLRETVSGPI